MKRIIPLLLTTTIFLVACAPDAAPTMSPSDVQGTAVAAASTLIVATHQKIPTSTRIVSVTKLTSPIPPPTFTPGATLTPPVLPTATLSLASQPPENCLHPLNMAEAGPKKRVRIENQSGGTGVNLSLNLYQPNAVGQCGVLSWANKPANWAEIIELPSGSWFAYAWISGKKGNTEASGFIVLGNSKSDDLLRLIIKTDVINLVGP